MNLVSRIITTVCLGLFSTHAMSALIDFEGFDVGTIIDNEYRSEGIMIWGENHIRNSSNLAVIFDTNNYTGGDSDLAATFTNNTLGTLNPGNILIIHEHPRRCDSTTCRNPDDEGSRFRNPDRPSVTFNFKFEELVTLNSIDFFDIERAEGGGTFGFNAIKFFDMNGQEIYQGAYSSPFTGGDNAWERLNFAGVTGVRAMSISLGGSGGIDNINYTVEVSEPGTLALLSLSLVGFFALRARRNNRS